jgi:hypothetical protein
MKNSVFCAIRADVLYAGISSMQNRPLVREGAQQIQHRKFHTVTFR